MKCLAVPLMGLMLLAVPMAAQFGNPIPGAIAVPRSTPAPGACTSRDGLRMSLPAVQAAVAATRGDSVAAAALERQIAACGVRFTREALIPIVAALPSGVSTVVASEVGRYERDERDAFKRAADRRLVEFWREYLGGFPDGTHATEAKAELARAATFPSLRDTAPIRSGLSAGWNQLEFFLLKVWHDGTYVRAFYKVKAPTGGRFGFDPRDSQLPGSFGYDDTGRPLRAQRAFLANRLGESFDTLAAAASDVFYLDIFLIGAAPDARSVTLLSYPFLRTDQRSALMANQLRTPIVHLNWTVPIAAGVPSPEAPSATATFARDMSAAGPMAEWRCEGMCTAAFPYFGPYNSPGRMTDPGAPKPLEAIKIRFFGASRTAFGSPDNRARLLLVYGLTNGGSIAQLLRPHWNTRRPAPPPQPGGLTVRNSGDTGFLIQGSDDLQHQVWLYWELLLDERYQSARDLWLPPGATAYAAFEAVGADSRATTIDLRGRLLVNMQDQLRLRLPAP